jgi:hypothetical protein
MHRDHAVKADIDAGPRSVDGGLVLDWIEAALT